MTDAFLMLQYYLLINLEFSRLTTPMEALKETHAHFNKIAPLGLGLRVVVLIIVHADPRVGNFIGLMPNELCSSPLRLPIDTYVCYAQIKNTN